MMCHSLIVRVVVSQARFVQIIKDLHQKTSNIFDDSLLFRFENSGEAALPNAIVLECYNFSINDAILAQPSSIVSYGSEFKEPSNFQELLQGHPHWDLFNKILTKGATFPLNHISNDLRLQDIMYHKERGNHKSAEMHNDALASIIENDIVKGYALPLPPEILLKIPNASLAPLGCICQDSINEQGLKTSKFRMTHDQTFPGPSKLSVNLRVKKEELPPCMYSFVLCRVIHYIVSLRLRHPSTRLYICKYDIDLAYRRCHLSGETGSECLTIYNNMLLMALRMTFRGAPCPSLWGIISDTIADTCNSLIHNPCWDHSLLYDHLSMTIDLPNLLPESIDFAPAQELAVDIPTNDVGKVDMYIDDTIGIALDLADNVTRVQNAVPLVIKAFA